MGSHSIEDRSSATEEKRPIEKFKCRTKYIRMIFGYAKKYMK